MTLTESRVKPTHRTALLPLNANTKYCLHLREMILCPGTTLKHRRRQEQQPSRRVLLAIYNEDGERRGAGVAREVASD